MAERTLLETTEVLQQLLHSHNHIFPRSLLYQTKSVSEAAATKDVQTHSEIMSIEEYIFKLHGDPIPLFIASLECEIRMAEDLPVVMRGSSPSVRTLKHVWDRYDISPIISNLVIFVSPLTPRDLLLINLRVPPRSDSKWTKLKKELKATLIGIINQRNFPIPICFLCAKSYQLAKKYKVINAEIALRKWAVGNIIFLRAVIPEFLSVYDSSEKVPLLLASIMMKLCTDSQFQTTENYMLNELLVELSQPFEIFCEEVIEIGSSVNDSPSLPLCENLQNAYEKHHFSEIVTLLYDFLSVHGGIITQIIKRNYKEEMRCTESEMIPVDVSTNFQTFEPESLCRAFKQELSKSYYSSPNNFEEVTLHSNISLSVPPRCRLSYLNPFNKDVSIFSPRNFESDCSLDCSLELKKPTRNEKIKLLS